MTPLELALVTLVSVWTVLFCLVGVAGYYVVRDVRRMLERIDQILESTQGLTEDVRAPFAALAVVVREIFTAGPKNTAVPPNSQEHPLEPEESR